MSLLPSRLEVSPSPAEPKVLDIEGEEAAAAFDALGSETARAVMATIYDEPRTPSEVREEVGTTLQNVHYHLDRLEEAGLIEPVGSGYSRKGNEMTVYGPASKAVVLFAGQPGHGSRLREQLSRIFGLFMVVVISSLVFGVVHRWWTDEPAFEGATDDAEPLAAPEAAETTAATETVATLDPALAFFLGGCAVVVAVGLWWLVRPRLRSSSPGSSR